MYRALVIDDDQAIRRVVQKYLDPSRFEIDTGSDGLGAIRHLRSNRYDVVVLDLMMPSLSGFAVLEFILKEQPELVDRVAVMTSRAIGEENRICNHDFTGKVLRKPFTERDFKSVLQACLRAASGRGAK